MAEWTHVVMYLLSTGCPHILSSTSFSRRDERSFSLTDGQRKETHREQKARGREGL